MKQAVRVLLAALLSALLWLGFWNGSAVGTLFLAFVAQFPLMLVGIGYGTRMTLLAGASAVALAALHSGLPAAGAYAFAHALPVWAWLRLVLWQKPGTNQGGELRQEDFRVAPGTLLCWLAVLAASGLVLLEAASGGGTQVLAAAWLQPLFDRYSGLEGVKQAEAIAGLIPWFAGGAGALWVVLTAANAALAQALFNRGGRARRPSPVYKELALPNWATWLLLSAAVTALTGALLGSGEVEYMGHNLVLISVVPFFFTGLAVVHTLAGHVAYPSAFLAAAYLLGLIDVSWFAIALTGIGLIEHWAGLRRRFGEPKERL